MGKAGEPVECARLKKLIFERECEYEPRNKTCVKCDQGLMLGSDPIESLSVYTVYPPGWDFKNDPDFKNARKISELPAHVTALDLRPAIAGELEGDRESFKETGNPVYALRVLIRAHELGLYPPRWVIVWLVRAFGVFYKSNGRANLNRLLGFSKGQGQRTVGFKKILDETRKAHLVKEVGFLRGVFKLAAMDACRMVSTRLRKFLKPEKEEALTERNPIRMEYGFRMAPRTLYDHYSNNPGNKKWEHWYRRHIKWSEQEKRKYLEHYSSDSYEWKGGKLKLRMK